KDSGPPELSRRGHQRSTADSRDPNSGDPSTDQRDSRDSSRDSDPRDTRDRDSRDSRDVEARNTQPRDGDPRDSQPRDSRDSQPRDSQPRDSRDSQPRDAEPVGSQPADADPAPAEPVVPVSLSSPEGIKRAQGSLQEQGYYEGKIDGVMNDRTSGALKTYQHEHNLPETGQLDDATAKSLGINSPAPKPAPSRSSSRPAATPASTESSRPRSADQGSRRDSVPANVLGVSAQRLEDGSIYVLIDTQANTGGWRWFAEQAINGDTLELAARGVPPTGMVTQALTRGRIELTVKDGVQNVRRAVVHTAGA